MNKIFCFLGWHYWIDRVISTPPYHYRECRFCARRILP